jgi:hypothetical protein
MVTLKRRAPMVRNIVKRLVDAFNMWFFGSGYKAIPEGEIAYRDIDQYTTRVTVTSADGKTSEYNILTLPPSFIKEMQEDCRQFSEDYQKALSEGRERELMKELEKEVLGCNVSYT